MSREDVAAVARTLLYEGYMLYPYRPSSVKNRQRFNFGVIYPEQYTNLVRLGVAVLVLFSYIGYVLRRQ